MIPGGSKAGAGKVPGSDNGGAALEELRGGSGFSMDGAMDTVRKGMEWAEPVEKIAGQGLKILEDMENEVDDDDKKVMAARRKIWQAALDMCAADKAAFKKELGHTALALKKLTKPVTFTVEMPAWDNKDIAAYADESKALSRAKGVSTAAERATNAKNLKVLTAAVAQVREDSTANLKAAHALKQKLIK